MKLLLTSGGFTNKTIAKGLLELTGKKFKDLNLAFIPTAADVEKEDKSWLINDLYNTYKLGFKLIDIVNFPALPEKIWRPRLERADVLMFGGGNTFHLMYWLIKSGLVKELPKLLKTRAYVGVSAGSMIASESLLLSQSEKLYYEEIGDINEGLGFVNFHIRPHLNSKWFPKVTTENLEAMVKKIPEPVYAIDDNSAVLVNGPEVKVISEGKWKRFN